MANLKPDPIIPSSTNSSHTIPGNSSDFGDIRSNPATVEDDFGESRHPKRRKSFPNFSLLQVNKLESNSSSFNFSFATEVTTTTPDVTPKFGSFNTVKRLDSGKGLPENGHSRQALVKKTEEIGKK